MSGRGKGGKGLGVGGAKRHRRVLRDNIKGLTNPPLQRISHQAGVKSMSGLMYDELRTITRTHLEKIIIASITYAEHDRRVTVSINDVLQAIEDHGDKLAFSNAMTRAARACKT